MPQKKSNCHSKPSYKLTLFKFIAFAPKIILATFTLATVL